jgi:small subunit ribosomal protein S16
VAVRIRLKKLGRRHRPFFRVCAMDARSPRDGRVIEELGYYDPMCKETDARAVLKKERIDYWLSVGAQPSGNVSTLIKKYGTEGTHLNQQAAAFERLKIKPQAPPPEAVPAPVVEAPAEPEATEAPADDAPAAEAPAEETPEASAETTEESSE